MGDKLEPLFEQLEKDKTAAGLNDQGEKDGSEKTPASGKSGADAGKSSGNTSARDRISARRDARNAGASPQGKGKSPQGDDGASRGSGGEPRGDGKGTSKDAGTSPEPGSPSPGGEGDLLDPEKTGTPAPGEEVEEDEEELSPAEQAYYRRKNREINAENARLKEELEAAKKAPPAGAPPPAATTPAPGAPTSPPAKAVAYDEWLKANPQPDKAKDVAAWLVWNAESTEVWRTEQGAKEQRTQEQTRINTLVTQARQEIEETKDAYKKTNPDFEPAYDHGKAQYFKAVKALMPHYSDAQIQAQFDKEVFTLALKCDRDKVNLGEALYDMAIERFGYVPSSGAGGSASPTPPPAAQGARPNLRVIQKNQSKSATPMSKGGGEGTKPRVTLAQAADMSPEELMALDATDWDYLESQGVV